VLSGFTRPSEHTHLLLWKYIVKEERWVKRRDVSQLIVTRFLPTDSQQEPPDKNVLDQSSNKAPIVNKPVEERRPTNVITVGACDVPPLESDSE
jgi:hypothetical protein